MTDLHHGNRNPVVKATVKAIEALKHSDKAYYKFFSGGLAVRVMPMTSRKRANKTLYFFYREASNKKYYKLGHFNSKPETHLVGDISLEDANKELRRLTDRVNAGDYPHLTAATASTAPKSVVPGLVGALPAKQPFETITISKLVDEYLEFIRKPNHRSGKTPTDKAYILEEIIKKEWADRTAISITKTDAVSFIKKIAEGKRTGKTSEGMAREVMKTARAMFNWKVVQENKSYGNPFTRTQEIEEIAIIVGTSKHEPHKLDDDEIVHVWNVLNDPAGPCSASTARAFLLTLITAQRPGEVAGMHRSEIHAGDYVAKKTRQKTTDISGAWWVIPWQRIKTRRAIKGKLNKKDHMVYLSPLALKIIGDYDGFIFPQPNKPSKPISEAAMSHAVLKERILDNKVSRYFGLKTQWRPNDLRRTGRTILAALECPRDIAERILNHSQGVIVDTYDMLEYSAEKKKWSSRLSKYIEDILAGHAAGSGATCTTIRLTEERYDVDVLRSLVAAMPLTAVAKRLCVSNNAVKKRCLKNGIPLQPQGHWLKAENKRNLG